MANRGKKHWHPLSQEYSSTFSVWYGLNGRCRDPYYKDIQIDPKLFYDFEYFLKCLGPRPSLDHSLDRIDNNKGYTAGNLRWATHTEQMNNRRAYGSVKNVMEKDVCGDYSRWMKVAKANGINGHTYRSRVKDRGWDYARAATKKV